MAQVLPFPILEEKKNNNNKKFSGPTIRRVPLCAVKTCAVRLVFVWVVGELRAANPSKCPRPHEAKC